MRILVHLGQDGPWLKAAIDDLANLVISDEEAGQRGRKRSVLFRMIASAYISNSSDTVRLLRAIKDITLEKAHFQAS